MYSNQGIGGGAYSENSGIGGGARPEYGGIGGGAQPGYEPYNPSRPGGIGTGVDPLGPPPIGGGTTPGPYTNSGIGDLVEHTL
ncbi:unnamed protein product [Strongylus vulgaris]|uniref:Uncharacterized protein n=1 Tax=Strongylus vulgaris TaxID=40348 RepID=A0A3P7J4V5_STRVU|nr:unnamed protein product [Strongylus vulgaris]